MKRVIKLVGAIYFLTIIGLFVGPIVPTAAAVAGSPGKTVSTEQSVDANGAANLPVEVTREAATFSVALPTSLPVNISADGTTTVATDAAITNNSTAPIKIKQISAEALNDWSLTAYNESAIKGMAANSQKVGIQLTVGSCTTNTSTTGSSEIMATNADVTIANGQKSVITYNVVIPGRTSALSNEKIANVVFTVGWGGV